jgi:hypothetical protein
MHELNDDSAEHSVFAGILDLHGPCLIKRCFILHTLLYMHLEMLETGEQQDVLDLACREVAIL